MPTPTAAETLARAYPDLTSHRWARIEVRGRPRWGWWADRPGPTPDHPPGRIWLGCGIRDALRRAPPRHTP